MGGITGFETILLAGIILIGGIGLVMMTTAILLSIFKKSDNDSRKAVISNYIRKNK